MALGRSAEVSRKTKARRRARKVRVVLAQEAAAREAAERAALPPRPLTPEEERRVRARFSNMYTRNLRWGLCDNGIWLMERDRRAEKLEKAARRLGVSQSELPEK